MLNQIIVRKAGIKDALIISSIGVSSWQAAYRGIISDTYLDSLSVEKKEVQLAKSFAIPENQFAVAEIDNQAVGMMCFRPDYRKENIKEQDCWEIEAIYVLPQYWRIGIGRALIKYAFRHMKSININSCGLWVLVENHRARKFYETIGFYPSGIERPISIGGKELIEMHYTIDLNDMLAKKIYNMEMQLLRPEVRISSEKLAELLWDDMIEFCSSGFVYQYKKNDVIEKSLNSSTLKWKIKDFKIKCLSDDIILVTYMLDKNSYTSTKPNHSLRSSIWKSTDGKWKMFFHQGTPVVE